MATYTGALTSSGLPELAVDGEIDFPAMTLRRALHVNLRDAQGFEKDLKFELAPGSAGSDPSVPLYVASVSGSDFRVRFEGGELDRILEAVTVKGFVTADLSPFDKAAMQTELANLAAMRTSLATLADPHPVNLVPGTDPDNPIYVTSLDGQNNRVRLEGGNVSSIDAPVTVLGGVTSTLSLSDRAVLNAIGFDADQGIALLQRLVDPHPIEAPLGTFDNPIWTTPQAEQGAAKMQLATNSVRASITVSTTAVRLAPANSARLSLLICNNGTGSLYVGDTSAVTSSGANMGAKVPSSGRYSDTGQGVYVGEVWGIYDAAATAQNVVVLDRS